MLEGAMKKQYPCLSGLAIFALMLLVIGSRAYADEDSRFNNQFKAIQAHRALIEAKLGIKPRENNYDVADHYAQGHLTHDVMEDEGLW
jgi:hypothetical protein